MKTAVLMLAAFTAALAGCATPTTLGPHIANGASAAEAEKAAQYVFEARWSEIVRLEEISYKLLTANQDLCPDKKGRIGLRVAGADDFKPPLRDAATRVLNLTPELRVTHVVPESPSAIAGLQRGDELVSLNGWPIPRGAKASEQFAAELTRSLANDAAKISLVVRRGAETKTLAIVPRRSCAYDAQILDTPDINAYADGQHIFVTRPLLKLASSDEELALVVAHELAHNAERHMNAKRKNATLAGLGGAAFDILAAAGGVNTQGAFTKAAMQAGAGFSSPEFEAEADYVGMYFMARAGYRTDGAENFWRKMAIEHPKAIFTRSSHPATPDRYVAIAATNKEIAGKRAAGMPLTPNRKPATAAPAGH